jgi:hypothetical protein
LFSLTVRLYEVGLMFNITCSSIALFNSALCRR